MQQFEERACRELRDRKLMGMQSWGHRLGTESADKWQAQWPRDQRLLDYSLNRAPSSEGLAGAQAHLNVFFGSVDGSEKWAQIQRD